MSLALASETSAAISAFQSRRRSLLLWRGCLAGLVVTLALILVLALFDRAWFVPDSARPWLSIFAYLAAMVVAWRQALSFIHESRDIRDAAKLLESAEPSLRQRLLAAVELATTGRSDNVPDSPEFRAQLQKEVAAATVGLRWSKILPTRSLRPWALRLVALLAVGTGLSFIPQLHLPGFLARAALPFAKIERPSSVKIKIVAPSPASTLAPYVSEMLLAVDVTGQIPERVLVEYAEVSATVRTVEMQRLTESRFEATLPVGQSDLRYRVSGGDAQTLWHTLDARPRPAITEFVKTIVPPAYTGLEPTTASEDQGDIEALDGSTVKLALKVNQPISLAAVAINTEDPSPPQPTAAKISPPDGVSAEISVKEANHSWIPRLTAAETGFTNEESTPWRITTIPDLPPSISLTDPKDQVQSLPDESLRIRGVASDDIGLKSIALSHSLNAGEWTSAPLPAPSGKESAIETLLSLPPMHLEAGDSLQIKFVATDLKGQTADSNILQVAILQQTVDPRLRAWSEAQTKLADTAAKLEQQTRELREASAKVQKDAQLQQRGKPAIDPQGQLARMKSALDQAKATADDLWSQVKEAARTAPDALTQQEAQLLGQRVSKLRAAPLPLLEEATHAAVQDPEPLRKQAAEAAALADSLNKAAQTFAAEATAKIAQQSAAHQARQAALLTESALPSNRDASQRPKWQQQQRAAMATTSTVQKDLAALEASLPDRGMARQTEQLGDQIAEASRDLAESLDRKDQTKSPEHLYGAADNLRQRLSRAADATQGIAETMAQRAAQLREQLGRQENPALATLDDAKASLQDAANDAKNPPKKPRPSKDGLTSTERAQKRLAEAAKQLQDQSELRQQAAAQADQGAVDANRASRAADQLARETKEAAAKNDPTALAAAQEKATQLAKVARTLEADAAVKSAQDALAQTPSPQPGSKPDLAQDSAQTRAASEALRRATEPLRRDQATQPAANIAQQAADLARNAADQLRDQAKQAQTNRDFQPTPVANRDQAAQKAAEVAAAIAPSADAAREALGELTPAVSDMMKALAQDLRATNQDTKSAAADAKAEKPVDDVAKQAQNIQPKAATDAQRMEAVQAALRTEANQADLAKADQRQLSRTADVALAQMQGKSPQIAQNLRQAAQAQASQPQAQALDAAAAMQQQTAEALDQLAQNFSQMEQGKELSEKDLAGLQQMEQQMGVQEPLDEAYDRAQELAQIEEMAKDDPAAALAMLEKELPKNPVMQKALAEIGRQAAETSEQAVTQELSQPVSTGMATAQAAHDLERVARHAQRLGDEPTAQQVAQASKELQQAAKTAKENPNTPTPQSSQAATAAAQQASKAAERSADNAPPAMAADPFQQLQSTLLAQALDQLDQTVHPAMGDQPSQSGDQQQQQQGQQQGQQQQQGAQQSLSDANQSQQQSMAQARNQGKVPGSQQSKSPQNLAKNQQQSQNNTSQNSSEGGNFDTQLKDGAMTGELILVQGDWGHLPSKTAEELSEATRQDAPPEYRAAIENYYKSIATRSKQR